MTLRPHRLHMALCIPAPFLREEAELDGKVNFLIKVLKYIIAESGFELLARIELRDKRTGRCFR